MPKSARLILQTIADRCDARTPDGTLTGCFGGGRAMARSAGVSEATYWRGVTKLCRAGMLVLLGRGGLLKVRSASSRVRAISNAWGIPGTKGGLDDRAAARELCRMAQDDGGAIRRQVFSPGQTPELFLPAVQSRRQVASGTDRPIAKASSERPTGEMVRKERSGVEQNRFVPRKCEYPTRKMRVPHSQNASLPSPLPSPLSQKDHDHGGFAAKGGKKASHGATEPRSHGGKAKDGLHVTSLDLSERQRFADLVSKAADAGLVDLGAESDVEWLFGARAHALRVGENPPALFATMVRRNLRLFVTAEDEEAGHRLRKEWLNW